MSKKLPITLGLMHGVADCISGWLIGSAASDQNLLNVGALILLYNVLAFAGQLPAGMLVDRFGSAKNLVVLSGVLLAVALIVAPFSMVIGIALAGLGSCIFHVSGGMAVLSLDPGNATSPGIFAGPGVAGLAVGGYLAIQSIEAGMFLFPALAIVLALVIAQKFPDVVRQESSEDHGFEAHDVIMILLLLAIAFRSAVWTLFDIIHKGDLMLAVAIGLAACSGKLAGGFLADIVGWKRYAVGALTLSAAMLTIAPENVYVLLPGVALLQSATPVAIAAMHKVMPRQPATAAGLSLGFGLALGGIPFFSGLSPGDLGRFGPAIGLIIAAAMYYWVLSQKKLEKLPDRSA